MVKIGLLSDTHACWDDRYAKYFAECDEIWHAGDIGGLPLYEQLETLGKPLRAVCGNIDGQDLRRFLKKVESFRCEEVDVLMTHIGGYPGKYAPGMTKLFADTHPKLFVCGHSHILKVQYDPTRQMLCINPGAAGTFGFHKVRTLVRFTIDGKDVKDLEVVELSESA